MGVVGKSGMGKTTYALRYVQGSHHDRVFVFDHQGEFRVRFNARPEQVAIDGTSFLAAAEKYRMVFFDPAVNFGGTFAEVFAEFCGMVQEVCMDHFEPAGMQCLFVCDEVQKFCKIGSVPPQFKSILETGRRNNLDTLCLSQRPNKIDSDIREQWTEIVFFRLTDRNTLKFIEDCGAGQSEVCGLAPHEFLFFQTEKSEERRGVLEFSPGL